MVSELFFYQLALIALLWLCCMLHWAWPNDCTPAQLTPSQPTPLRSKRRREPKPFAGVTHKPHCDACAQAGEPRSHAPLAPPRIVTARGRRRTLDTSHHFCPNPDCASRGWVGRGDLRANGHPSGGPGGSCSVSPATAISLKPMARSFMASVPPSSSSCASSPA